MVEGGLAAVLVLHRERVAVIERAPLAAAEGDTVASDPLQLTRELPRRDPLSDRSSSELELSESAARARSASRA